METAIHRNSGFWFRESQDMETSMFLGLSWGCCRDPFLHILQKLHDAPAPQQNYEKPLFV